ncbi:MAG: M13 family metallopeptidase [Patescibacteria group bacterium]
MTKLDPRIKLDTTIRPQDDIFGYACNLWVDENPIPDDKSRWSSFAKIAKKTNKQIRDIITDMANAKDPSADRKLVAAYYKSYMDKDLNSEKAVASLNKILGRANDSSVSIEKRLAELHLRYIDVLAEVDVSADSNGKGAYSLSLYQPELSLPNRSYYLDDTEEMDKFRNELKKHIKRLVRELKSIGVNMSLNPDTIYEYELMLAEHSWEHADLRDPGKTNNLYTVEQLQKRLPIFDWTIYLDALGVGDIEYLYLATDSYFYKLFEVVDLADEKLVSYMQWRVISGFSGFISEEISQLNFDFYGTVLHGQKELKPLDERATDSTDAAFFKIVEKEYIKRHFPEESKESVDAIAKEVTEAFRTRLGKLEWLSQSSRDYAQKKLDRMIVNTGYSKETIDYSGLELSNDCILSSAEKVRTFNSSRILKKTGQPVDRESLGMTRGAQFVNAWTNPVLLNSCYPASILQWPFFDADASHVHNLSAVGSTVGHELTHNFDTAGSQYDLNGELNEWLTDKDKRKFDELGQIIIDQADSYEVAPGVNVIGKQVLPELIADLGGVEIVVDIIKSQYDGDEQKAKLQELFIGYAHHWASSSTQEYKIMLAKSDEHPEIVLRVNGILEHVDAFHEAFDTKPGDKLYRAPEDRARIW